ncbi:MAG: hypothetical protein C5B51_26450 [Terriglobia bacterium]|nr:MAG: hypothetical protein C5B51_26450 [Terriglobia bacterium]
MTDDGIERVLAKSTGEVLEQMFFVRALNEPNPSPPATESQLVAEVSFEGQPSGRLGLRVNAAAARSIAADFLGEDECSLSEGQVGEVICELANIICGSVLSSVESETTFRLKSPRLLSMPEEFAAEGAVVHSVTLDRGVLGVAFSAEKPICPLAV